MKQKSTLYYRVHISQFRSAFGLLLLTCLLMGGSAFAQNRVVSGKVTDAKTNGLPGVSIIIKGTTTGTTTDANGDYSLSIPSAEATLTYSYIGFDSQSKTVGSQSVINITLVENTAQLNEVIVTALGIKKEARTIGYTTQDIAGDQLVKAREPNPVNSLTGKIAGLTVGPSAEMLSKPKLLLRGNSDLLFVVDGVPINSDTWNVSADDIETYTVLKGPNAAALYGFRGQNGAIMITTKKGTKDKRKIAVDFNTSTMFESGFLALPDRQSEYGYGNNFKYAYGNKLYDEDGGYRRTNLWGPRFEGQNVPQYNSPVDPTTGIRQGTPGSTLARTTSRILYRPVLSQQITYRSRRVVRSMTCGCRYRTTTSGVSTQTLA